MVLICKNLYFYSIFWSFFIFTQPILCCPRTKPTTLDGLDNGNLPEGAMIITRKVAYAIIYCAIRDAFALSVAKDQKDPTTAFIGGGIDNGETGEEACLREISEETGLEFATVQLIETLNVLHIRQRGDDEGVFFESQATVFAISSETRIPDLGEETNSDLTTEWILRQDVASLVGKMLPAWYNLLKNYADKIKSKELATN